MHPPHTSREKMGNIGITTLSLLFGAMMFLLSSPAFGQTRTLLNTDELHSGLFGGPQVYWTTFNGESGLLVGGSGAWVINRTFYLGGGGFGLTSRHEGPALEGYDSAPRLGLEYGGLLFGFILKNDDLLHLTADLMIGGGTVSNQVEVNGEWERHGAEGFWHVQPLVHAEVNVTEWLRIALSGGVRYVGDLNSFGVDGGDASGPVMGLTFRIGAW